MCIKLKRGGLNFDIAIKVVPPLVIKCLRVNLTLVLTVVLPLVTPSYH